jgi:hypothetical protein
MEPRNTGTGNVAAEQNAAASPSTTNTLGTTAAKDKNRSSATSATTAATSATQETASFSPPGVQGQKQIGHVKSDGR